MQCMYLHISTFQSTQQPMKKTPFYRWENWGLGFCFSFSKLPKVTEPELECKQTLDTEFLIILRYIRYVTSNPKAFITIYLKETMLDVLLKS